MGMSEMNLDAAVAVAASRQGGCDLDDEGGPCSECLGLVRDLIEAAAPLIAAAALRDARDEIAGMCSPNYGMHPDGTEDPVASAYADGLRDAWSSLNERADSIEAAT
jgi:hypothetical protein